MAAPFGKAPPCPRNQLCQTVPLVRAWPPLPQGRRTPAAVRAEADRPEQPRGLNFKANRNSGLGYTDDDSAGQSNIFAVEPKQYVQGSSRDGTSVSLAAPLIAGAVAIGAIGLGLFAIRGFGTDASAVKAEASSNQYLTLSEYKQQFASEVSAAPGLRSELVV